MAEIVVKRDAIGAFLDELPGLIMQYKQMQWAQEERMLDREDRKAQAAQGILLKEYYDMKGQVQATEKMFDKYDNLSPSDITQAGAEIISIVDKQNNINMDAITQNLNTLSEYKSDLESSLSNLRSQASTLKQMQSEFAGADMVMLPHEYEAFQEHALKSLEEGGLGWDTTAGADVEYFKTDPTTRYTRALQITEKMKSDHEVTGKGDYAIMQGMMQLDEGEDIKDLADRLEYKDSKGNVLHRPSEGSLGLLQNLALQTNFQDFVTAVQTYPSEAGGDQLRSDIASNPNLARIYQNIAENSQAINTLDRELAGINLTPKESNYDEFIEQISGVTNQEALFGLYDRFTQGLDPAEHGQYFDAIELATGIGDLYPAYKEFKGISTAGDVNTETQQQLNARERFDARLTGGGLFKEGSRGEEPMLNLAGGFIPVPNIEWFLDQTPSLIPSADMPDVPFASADALNVALDDLDEIASSISLRWMREPSKFDATNTELYEEYLKSIGD